MEGLPRPLVDFLKVSAIIRGATTALGATVNDRLRINATYALKVRLCGCLAKTAATFGLFHPDAALTGQVFFIQQRLGTSSDIPAPQSERAFSGREGFFWLHGSAGPQDPTGASAAQGMSISRLPDGRVRYEGSLAKRRKRLQIGASIFLLRMMFWIRSTVAALWTNVPGRLFAGGARPEPLLLEG